MKEGTHKVEDGADEAVDAIAKLSVKGEPRCSPRANTVHAMRFTSCELPRRSHGRSLLCGGITLLKRVGFKVRRAPLQLPGLRHLRYTTSLSPYLSRSLTLAAEGEEDAPDEPDLALGKAKELNIEAELEETEIKKVAADEATPYSSAATFEELNLTPELLQVCVPSHCIRGFELAG